MGGFNCYSILVWWMFIPLIDAEICEFYEKIVERNRNNWNDLANVEKKYSRIRYKIERYSWYCFTNQYCCWKDCCFDYGTNSNEDGGNDTALSSGSIWGIIVGVATGSCLCLACCVKLCKSGSTTQTSIPMAVARSGNGTVVIRRSNPEETVATPSIPPFPERQNTIQHSRSGLDVNSYSEHGALGSDTQRDTGTRSSPAEYDEWSSQTTDYRQPPPSYEYVMSHDFPVTTSGNSNRQTD